jgi:hypothetical protein
MVCVTSRKGLTYRKGIGVKLQILYKCSQHYMMLDSVYSFRGLRWIETMVPFVK